MTNLAAQRTTPMLNKVPEVTIYFWIIKILATTVGETGADFMSVTLNLGLGGTSMLMAILLAAVLAMQIRAQRYVPWIYWFTTVLVSVVGTLITDSMVDILGVSLPAATAGFAVALTATFAAWYASERTLSIHSIHTRRRELFYWAAILFTFALGTAAGDLTAEGLGLGYAPSALAFGALISLVTMAYYSLGANAILTFWIAYILTRPLGASLGDLLSQPTTNGGIGLGTVLTSIMFIAIIGSLVVWLSLGGRDPDLGRTTAER
ncbi:COG4705 family protein [Muricoccus vinaceus]|uniref:Membrane-anchored protein n=1 Tax=Muricoccus vinaceus TaxID=424704 RepID=A0ABV6IVS0_9PROT